MTTRLAQQALSAALFATVAGGGGDKPAPAAESTLAAPAGTAMESLPFIAAN